MNGLCNLAITWHLYYPTLRTILSSFFAFIVKSLLPILMCEIQVVSLHNVLKQNTGAYCSAHNLFILSLSKSVYSLPPVPSYSHQAASTSVCWGLGWWLFFFLFCAVWCTITYSVSKTRYCCLPGWLYLQRPWALWISPESWWRLLMGFSFFSKRSLFDFLSFFPPPLIVSWTTTTLPVSMPGARRSVISGIIWVP